MDSFEGEGERKGRGRGEKVKCEYGWDKGRC